jgi:crossover junction endodeoxyribonuclease RusA
MLKLELPYPPTVNMYWRRRGNQYFISAAGKSFRRSVGYLCLSQQVEPLAGLVAIDVQLHPPDRIRRDVDNVLKALLDALQHGGVYQDDYQISRLTIERCDPVRGGCALVTVSPYRKER